jgi:hypothetical protein
VDWQIAALSSPAYGKIDVNFVGLFNSAWMLACSREASTFAKATQQVAKTQVEVLAAILQENRDTEFGRAHGFRTIAGAEAYQARVPLSRYEDYAQAIGRIAEGKHGVLTRARVELLEPTSGTTGGEKLIPYTAALRRQFQRAVAAWVADLFQHRPALRHGRAYWSISPAFGSSRQTSGRIPIGFDNDADYLGAAGRWLLKRLLVVPADVARLRDIDQFRYRTLGHLLAAPDLSLVSVWSPTFLPMLLGPLEDWHDRLCFDIEQAGQTSRAAELRRIFRAPSSLAEKLRRIWPRLALISCWADASSAPYLGQLREFFPELEIQPKGLLATEGCVSFPLLDRLAPVLAVRSHFFEFQEIDAPEHLRLAHELERGGRYRVVLTTAGGLYRYELRDEVEVLGFENQCPLLRFLGRSDGGCDLVGEKLAESHVRTVLDRLLDGQRPCSARRTVPAFTLLVPVDDRPPRYRLFVESTALGSNPAVVVAMAGDLEAGLCENPHYAYARRLVQLAPVEIVVLDPGKGPAWELYQRHCLLRGMRLGNIKPVALDAWPGWSAIFAAIRKSDMLQKH